MSYRELRERQLAEKWNPLRDAVATIVAEIRNSVSTSKLWTAEELLGDRPRPDDDEEPEVPLQTVDEIAAMFQAAGVEVKRGDHH